MMLSSLMCTTTPFGAMSALGCVKDKRLASGGEDKFKARLVADGSEQDKSEYETLSSPTGSTTSILIAAGIAAMESRKVMACDIGGAYLNADMAPTGVVVHMRLDNIMTRMLVEIDPNFAQFVEKKGTSVVALDKALYGCVESANLWYKHLRRTLVALIGYTFFATSKRRKDSDTLCRTESLEQIANSQRQR